MSFFASTFLGSNVSAYTHMVCETLRNSIPKAVVHCQVREAKRTLLDNFFAEMGKKEVGEDIWICDLSKSFMILYVNLHIFWNISCSSVKTFIIGIEEDKWFYLELIFKCHHWCPLHFVKMLYDLINTEHVIYDFITSIFLLKICTGKATFTVVRWRSSCDGETFSMCKEAGVV